MKSPSKHILHEQLTPLILKSCNHFIHPKFGRVDMTFHPLGLPVRHVITHGGKRVVGSYPSAKMGRTMPWESFGERALVHTLEFNHDCAGYLVQPHTLAWSDHGVPYTYVPDAIAETSNGITVYEVKKVHPHVHSPEDELEKYPSAAAIYGALGWCFEIITEGELTANGQRLVNHHELSLARFTAFGLAEELIVRDYLGSAGDVGMFSSLIAHLGNVLQIAEPLARATILAMAVRRIVRFDLDKRITPVSPVHLVAPRAPKMSVINFWEKTND